MPEQDAFQNPPSDQEPGPPAPEAWPSVGGSPAQLVLVSTPIGNLGDVTSRAIAALRGADTVLCEDSRVTARLLFALGVKARLESFHDHNEESRTPKLLALMRSGEQKVARAYVIYREERAQERRKLEEPAAAVVAPPLSLNVKMPNGTVVACFADGNLAWKLERAK